MTGRTGPVRKKDVTEPWHLFFVGIPCRQHHVCLRQRILRELFFIINLPVNFEYFKWKFHIKR